MSTVHTVACSHPNLMGLTGHCVHCDADVCVQTSIVYKVQFVGVGRDQRSWTSTLRQHPTESILERLVRKHGGLASRAIECVFDEDLEHGTVMVGGYRPVGAFRVVAARP